LYSDNPLIGSWAGDSVIVTGDYADEGKFVPVKNRKENLYTYAYDNYEDISQEVICCLCEDKWWKQEYYNQWKAQNFEDWNEERQHMKENLFGIRGCKMEMEGQDA
jgi:hypothetical protein